MQTRCGLAYKQINVLNLAATKKYWYKVVGERSNQWLLLSPIFLIDYYSIYC